MSDTQEFFSQYLPKKIANDPELRESVSSVFQFEIKDAGSWVLDMSGEGTVTEGQNDAADCVITTSKVVWEQVLDNPAKAVQMVMMRKLTVSNLGLATQLQKILS